MLIRSELPTDAAAIHSLVGRAFAGAPHSDGSEPHIVRALRDGGALAVALVAEAEGTVVGHVAISPVSITDGSAGCVVLGDPAYYSRFGSSWPHGRVAYHAAFAVEA